MKQYRIDTDIIDLEWIIFRKYELPENFDDPVWSSYAPIILPL